MHWFVLVFVLEYLLNYDKYQKFVISNVYQIKHDLPLFRNINMFINNHIQIHQHQTMIERYLNIIHFFLSTIYGFLLTFGFIMITPQLFINYKLKSASHLPWRMMIYKALNTFIDDLFAFYY
jgi:hypothetical protein